MLVTMFLDGGFVKTKWRQAHNNRYPGAKDVHDLCVNTIMKQPEFAHDELFRIFFYDCFPFQGKAYDPKLGKEVNCSDTPSAEAQKKFLKNLGMMPHTAIRAGELAYNGVKVRTGLDLSAGGVTLQAGDLVPDFQQKQVDIKIGLDIAWTAIKGIAGKIVLVAGDSDLIPAMKFARKEGILVYLASLGHHVKRGMIEHADGFLEAVTP